MQINPFVLCLPGTIMLSVCDVENCVNQSHAAMFFRNNQIRDVIDMLIYANLWLWCFRDD